MSAFGKKRTSTLTTWRLTSVP